MNDLTLKELENICDVFTRCLGASELSDEEMELRDRFIAARDERRELESMDLDDCLGGACKL